MDSERDIRQEKVRDEFMNSLRQINQYGEDIKRLQQREGDENAKRASAFRRQVDRPSLLEKNVILKTTLLCRAMSTAPEDSSARSNGNGYGTASNTPLPTKRHPQQVYKRSLSLEQSQNLKEVDERRMDYDESSYRDRSGERDPSLDR